MMETTVRVMDGRLDLPRAIVNWIGTAHELGLFLEGDTLILKKMQPARLSEIALRVLEDEMPMDKIVARCISIAGSAWMRIVIDSSTLISAVLWNGLPPQFDRVCSTQPGN